MNIDWDAMPKLSVLFKTIFTKIVCAPIEEGPIKIENRKME